MRRILCTLICTLVAASASASRVFVASTGLDTNPCTRTAPCRTFAFAITQVTAGGEIVALDTAGYGPFSVPFSISVYAAPGAVAAVSGEIDVTAAASTDTVDLRGLFIDNPNGYGLYVTTGNAITLDRITTSANIGIKVALGAASGPLQLTVTRSRFLDGSEGIDGSSASGAVSILVADSQFEGNVYAAIYALSNTFIVATDTLFMNTQRGVEVASNVSGGSQATVERCTFRDAANAMLAYNGTAVGRLAHSIVIGSTAALFYFNGGALLTRVDGAKLTNTIEDSTNPSAFSGTYNAK
jgi:parallel beta helix pectate lyase-like protein